MRHPKPWTLGALAAAALAVASATLGSVRATQAPADLIVVNARVFTGTGTPTQEALAIRGPLIAAVGSLATVESMKGPSTTTVDAGGASVLPGFNDSHVHFLSGAQSLQELDLSGARTLEEVQQRIRDFAAANPGQPGSAGAGGITVRSRAGCRRARNSTPRSLTGLSRWSASTGTAPG